MTKSFEKGVTRLGESDKSVMCWAKGEASMGLQNSLFVCAKGAVTQYFDTEEGEKFYEYVKNMSNENFNKICEEFFDAIENRDLEKMHKALAVFNEMDEYGLGSSYQKRRLLRIRETTESKAYEFKGEGLKDFIIYKGKVWKPI